MGKIVDPSNGKNEMENIPKSNVTQEISNITAIKRLTALDPTTMVIL